MGHFVNHGHRRSLSAEPALTAFGIAAAIFRSTKSLGGPIRNDPLVAKGRFTFIAIAPPIQVVSMLLWLCHLGVNVIGVRVAQRAEYYADRLAADAAGSRATMSFLDTLVYARGIVAVIGARSRNNETAAGWREGVEAARTNAGERLPRLRQLSIRAEAAIFHSHPQGGQRQRMLAEQPHREPKVVLTATESAAIDAELHRFEESYRLEIAQQW
jgi:Zn-dependent protease with chaperone function